MKRNWPRTEKHGCHRACLTCHHEQILLT